MQKCGVDRGNVSQVGLELLGLVRSPIPLDVVNFPRCFVDHKRPGTPAVDIDILLLFLSIPGILGCQFPGLCEEGCAGVPLLLQLGLFAFVQAVDDLY